MEIFFVEGSANSLSENSFLSAGPCYQLLCLTYFKVFKFCQYLYQKKTLDSVKYKGYRTLNVASNV